MSMASPTLRSSSSTVPGPRLSRLPTSIRARPSTAETWTGTSNTASRSAALRVSGSPPSDASAVACSVVCAAARSPSRSGSGILPSLSDIARASKGLDVGTRVLCLLAAAHGDVAVNGLRDQRFGRAPITCQTAVRPFDAAVAGGDLGLAEHDQTPFVAARARDVLQA